MSNFMYDSSVVVFSQMLNNLSGFLDKGQAYAEAKKFDSAVLVQSRLAPDMLPLAKQVQIASDFAKGCCSRLTGREVPKREDNEATIAELKARVAWTLDYIGSMAPEQFAGSDERPIVHQLRDRTITLPGLAYLTRFSMPNFYFHVTTAYGILRHNGVGLGKDDFTGRVGY